MSRCPKIIFYICTKQINLLRNSSEGHFKTPEVFPHILSLTRKCIEWLASVSTLYF